jgi:hypothetical protein
VEHWLSHDARWIYFSGDHRTGRDIWRVSPSAWGSRAVGPRGDRAIGVSLPKDLLFQPKDADSPLMAMALLPGAVRQLVANVRNSAFGTGPQVIYYVRRARGLMLDKVSEERGDDAEKDERTGQKRQNPIERRGV